MFPCSGYEKRNFKCVVSDKENSGRCSECVLRKAKCDAEGIPVSEWQALELETDCLEQESEAAMRAVCENMARLKRLEKQKKFLKSKGKDMVCCGLKTLDELEEAEEKERQIETERATAKAAATPSNVLALSLTEANPFVGVEVPLLSLEVWA
jgi:PHD/YefM family antitoxin component YafN of YafNO toxin-antitoxin module